MNYKKTTTLSLLTFALLSLSACDKVLDVAKGIGKTTCDDVKEQVVEISKGSDDFIEITDIAEVKDIKPLNVNLPGNLYLSCSANAFKKSGQKLPIFMFASKAGENDYFGYEQNEGKLARGIQKQQQDFDSQMNDAFNKQESDPAAPTGQ